MTAAEVRELLTSYVKENELVSQADRRYAFMKKIIVHVFI